MTNSLNKNIVYCTNDKKNFFISHDGGKNWQAVKDNNFSLSIRNGEIIYGYIDPASYTSDGKLIHTSRSTKYPFAPFIQCKNFKSNYYDFQADLNALRVLMFNYGARFVWDRKVRLVYDARLKEMKQYYDNQIAHGKMTHEEAGWAAKDMRNEYLKKFYCQF